MIATFATAKIGDKVWCKTNGWGEIRDIHTPADYPISVYFEDYGYSSYTTDGQGYEQDRNQTLSWDEEP